jgi:site-specific DNA recombinase
MRRVHLAMVKLLARGHRWHRKLFDGTHASIEDMAKSENISPSFVSRILRLAYLSPTAAEAILDGKYPAHLTMKDLMEPLPRGTSVKRNRNPAFLGCGR